MCLCVYISTVLVDTYVLYVPLLSPLVFSVPDAIRKKERHTLASEPAWLEEGE